jgi:hypothetical protein
MEFLRRLKSKKDLKETSAQSVQPIASDNVAPNDAFLAFRTITTMLAAFQSPNEFTYSGRNDVPDHQRRQLKVLDALSAVAVRQYEVVAAIAKNSSGPDLQVVVSVNKLEPAFDIPQHSDGFSSWSPLRWFITPNPRDPLKKKVINDSLTTQNTSVTLVDPNSSISLELSKASPDMLLDKFLLTEW